MMKALILTNDRSHPLELRDVEMPVPAPGQVRLRVKAAALNRRDYYISRGQYAAIRYDSIQGSDVCGIVDAVASDADEGWLGRRVVIDPGFHWGESEKYQGGDYGIIGMQRDGSFAEYMLADSTSLYAAPEHLDDVEAAALPLAGVTAYRAVFSRGQLNEGESVLVSGAGGGVAQFILQFAAAHGARVYVTTGTEEKIERAVASGAAGGVLYHADNWSVELRALSGGIDLAVDGAGGNGIDSILRSLNPGGRLVMYGSTLGRPEGLDTHRIFWRQLNIMGSTMGSPRDFAAMIEFVQHHKIKPVIDSVRPLTSILEAYERMRTNAQFGKLAIRIED